jgi:hypothetical protein
MDKSQPLEQFEVPGVWVGLEQQPVLMANQFLSQLVASDEIVVAIGQFTPPVVLGTAEQQAEQFKNVSFVQVRPVGRFGLTKARVREVIKMLETTLEQADRLGDLERGKREAQ